MKGLVSQLATLPKDSKQDDFVLALIDYFAKEFRTNNLRCHKNNGYVKVCLSNIYQDKYNSVVVDCCNGKMYLRGDGCRDKYFGRLSKFAGGRASDAYHCCNYNAKRIINRINKIEASMAQPKTVIARRVALDLRTNQAQKQQKVKVILDLRTPKKVADCRTKSKVVDLRTETPSKTAIARLREGTERVMNALAAFANKLKNFCMGA